MSLKGCLLIVSGIVLTALFSLFLATFCLIQLQEWLLRNRAEKLVADFQSIRLHASTWSDAQTLMSRWGAWGHYDGQCTSADCDYTITLADAVTDTAYRVRSDRAWRLFQAEYRLYELLGGKGALIRVRFQVQDGSIWRSGVWLRLEVPPRTQNKNEEFGYWIGLSAKSNDSLHQRFDAVRQRYVGPWILGTDEQLEQHPNYKAGRPGGCEICLSAEVTFTPAISQKELKRLTGYNLSCITQFRRCVNLPDVLPIARDWHFYPTTEPPYHEPPLLPPHPCAVPLFAVARDADRVLLVDVLSVEVAKGQNNAEPQHIETAKVRLVQKIKGTTPLAAGDVFEVQPSSEDVQESQTAEHLVAGKRYIILPLHEFQLPRVALGFCGVFEDSAEAEEQLKKGFAQNDLLRNRDKFGGAW